ncbi:ECF transporter S component [Plantibacter flavus]|uniref:ECF transporter S component n=1 Tax=Plantibacter flavus TaxID=150123 RepID=UPI003F17E13E
MKHLSTRLLLSCAAIAVAGALLNVGNAYVYNAVSVAAPWLLGVFAGIYLLPGVAAQAAFRRPGVGLLTQLLSGLLQAPFVPTGVASVLVFVVLGILIELPFLLGRYRYWGAWLFYASAVFSGLVYGAWWFAWLLTLNPPVWMYVVTPLILVLALMFFTWVARAVMARVARTGVFRGLQLPVDRRVSAATAPGAATA